MYKDLKIKVITPKPNYPEPIPFTPRIAPGPGPEPFARFDASKTQTLEQDFLRQAHVGSIWPERE